MRGIKRIILFLLPALIFIITSVSGQQALPAELWNNDKDYTFMYFPRPLNKTADFHIQTSRHFLAFDYSKFQLKDLRIIPYPLPEKEAVLKGLDFLPLSSDTISLLSCNIQYQGNTYKINRGSAQLNECQLIEAGKYFQRRAITNLGFESGAPAAETRLEISSWPDRLDLALKIKLSPVLDSGTLEMALSIPANIRHQILEESGRVLATDASGNGFVIFSPTDGSLSVLNGTDYQLSLGLDGKSEYVLNLTLLPVIGYQGQVIEDLMASEFDSLNLVCKQISPVSSNLTTKFDKALGLYRVTLRNDDNSLKRMERVSLHIENPADTSRIVRLDFSKPNSVKFITGISTMIRDTDLNPTGIAVQTSKDWHNATPDDPYNGPWYHGYTMMTIPANASVDLEFTLVNGYWGTVPAASHNQLSLVGWPGGPGGNQQWDQSAIGAWGETVCYEPDGGQAQSMVTDVRPLMVKSTDPAVSSPSEYNWTNNVGGADFFRFYDVSGEKQSITRIKTQFKRYCPNLTEVTYAGVTQGYEADFRLTTSIYRTDDYVRAVYRIRLDVKEAMDFNRLAIIQVGSETYSYTSEKKFAFGNEYGLIEEWATQVGGSTYRKTGMNTDGSIPWVSMHEAVNWYPDQWGATANRGLVVRHYDAVIAGEASKPYFSEYGSVSRSGRASSVVEINPAPGITQLQPGDFIEAEVVHIILPQEAASYYGPNNVFKQVLLKDEDTWKPIFREATGNDLKITAAKGTVLHKFPVVVEVNDQNEGEIEIAGGLGYVPVTFTGLTSFTDYDLRILKNGEEIILSEQENHGKDYWQTDYDPESKTWDITYSVPLDSAGEIEGQSSLILYNDFNLDQYIPWTDPQNLTFTDKADNPSPSPLNPSLKVAKAERDSGIWSNVHFQFPDYLDLSVRNTFKIKVYYEGTEPLPANCKVQFILRNNGIGSTQYSLIENISSANTWKEMTFECPGAQERDSYNQVWLFFSGPDNDDSTPGQTFYIDDLKGPPLRINPDKLELYTSIKGDSVIMDFTANKHLLETVKAPYFRLYKNTTHELSIKSIANDSVRIYLVLDGLAGIDGRDKLSLSYSYGEIRDTIGGILTWFERKDITNLTPIPPLFVNFIVSDQQSGSKIEGVLVNVDTLSMETSISGAAVFTLEPGTYNYSCSKEGYFPVDSFVVVATDTSINIYLISRLADIKFRVRDESAAVYKASIDLNGDVRQTNSIGLVLYSDLEKFHEYPYSITKEGYDTVQEIIILTSDTIIEATLTVNITSTGDTREQGLKIFPVPANRSLNLKATSDMKSIELFDLTGKVIFHEDLSEMEHKLDISMFGQGIYKIRIKFHEQKEQIRSFTIVR